MKDCIKRGESEKVSEKQGRISRGGGGVGEIFSGWPEYIALYYTLLITTPLKRGLL